MRMKNSLFLEPINSSVGLQPKIPKEPHLLYFGTENFEQIRFQSIMVPIPKL